MWNFPLFHASVSFLFPAVAIHFSSIIELKLFPNNTTDQIKKWYFDSELTHIRHMFHFYTPWKLQKTKDFFGVVRKICQCFNFRLKRIEARIYQIWWIKIQAKYFSLLFVRNNPRKMFELTASEKLFTEVILVECMQLS